MIYGNHEENTLKQFAEASKNADMSALMADGHLGYVMPIGGVVAYKDKISPAAVGFDIACGNMAIRLNVKCAELNLDHILDEIESKISFGMGKINSNPLAPRDHEIFDSYLWGAYPVSKAEKYKLKELARNQLGTVGGGNHYVDIFEDEDGWAWVGIHFGSRGLGHKTATGFLNLSVNGKWGERAKEQEILLDIHSDIGTAYWQCMELAGKYAYIGREWVCKIVKVIIGASRTYTVHNHHNFCWQERHGGEEYMIIRKGATPAFPGQESFIGGSMGDNAVIVEGVDSEKSKASLYSTVHGAGRVMSRTQAAGKRKWVKCDDGKKRPKIVAPGKVTQEMMTKWLKDKGVKLRGGGLDESPHAYRRLDDVLKEHEGTIKIKHVLRPVAVVMAGANTF